MRYDCGILNLNWFTCITQSSPFGDNVIASFVNVGKLLGPHWYVGLPILPADIDLQLFFKAEKNKTNLRLVI